VQVSNRKPLAVCSQDSAHAIISVLIDDHQLPIPVCLNDKGFHKPAYFR